MPTHPGLPDDLLEPRAWPEPVERVELIETHSAWILLGRTLAYKVKQAVRFPFLDFSQPEQRERALREELALNAPLAPGVYRRLVSITSGADGLCFDGDGAHVEWALEMRRLPSADMFVERLRQGTLEPAALVELAQRLAELHAQPLEPALAQRHASPAAVRAALVGNAEELVDELQRVGDDAALRVATCLCRDLGAAVDAATARLERRLEQGRVRDGHGDLHLGNICFVDGSPLVYDRLEFDRALRIQDVAADVAFLVMDLRVHARADLADAFLDAYVAATGDTQIREVLELFVAHRAAVRAKVELIRQRGGQARDALDVARAYLLRAQSAARPRPLAILIAGLSGTGKSHLARELSRDTGWAWLRTDVIRKQLFGLAPSARPDAAERARLYAPGVTQRVYATLLEHAQEHWRAGRSTLLDGTFLQLARRDAARAAASAAGVDCQLAWLECPDAVVRRRLDERQRRADDPSDADVRVYERQLDAQQLPLAREAAVHIDTRADAILQALRVAAAACESPAALR